MKNYTAVTIGPIYKTLHHVKSTKAVWAASYMFSWLVKQLIIKLNISKTDVILPYFEDVNLNKNYDVGLFPDRIMFNKEITDIGKIINNVIEEFAKLVANDIFKIPLDIVNLEIDVTTYLKDYIQFNHVTVSIADNENKIEVLSNYLNTIELKQKTITNANEDFLNEFFEKKYYNFLIKKAFDGGEERFPSTIEIAMGEYKKDKTNFDKCVEKLFPKTKDEDSVDNQQLFIDEIYKNAEFKKTKRNYQKYIAVIQADGDNVGKLITAIYDNKDKNNLISLFSKNLFIFAQQAVELIKAYNGTPIYAGGDDLLFICPVANTKYTTNDKERLILEVEKSIITLIKQIDELFDSLFKEDKILGPIIEKLKDKPSMSYGVSISYYKFPLTQALEQGVNQLFYKAKKTCEKNAVAFNILKHSGQNIAALFHKHLCSYNLFEALLTSKVADDNYVRSITYKLEPQAAVLFGIGCEKDFTNRNEKFDNFFRNNFNEDIHTKRNNKKEKVLIDFLEKTKELIKAIYTENPITTIEESNKNLNKVYTALRFVDFLNNEEER